MNTVSMICCYNNESFINDLKNSLNGYCEYNIEWVLFDNIDRKYSSAASALNYGFTISTGDILVFLHQDIIFDNQESLTTIIQNTSDNSIVGVAGSLANSGAIISSIYDGPNRERKFNSIAKKEIIEVQTCDECLIAITRNTFNKIGGFDEKRFNGWDFYVVDLTLNAGKMGIKNLIVYTELWHRSQGNKNTEWYWYEEEIRKKYKNDYCVINYPCGKCYTNNILQSSFRLYQPVKRHILDIVSYIKKMTKRFLHVNK